MLFVSQRTARAQQTGSRGNGRLEFKRRERYSDGHRHAYLVVWECDTHNQPKAREEYSGKKDVGRGTAVQGAGWAGMQKDPWARRAPAQVVKAAGGSKTRTAWCSNCRDLHFPCGDFQSRPLSKHSGPAGCRSAHLILQPMSEWNSYLRGHA